MIRKLLIVFAVLILLAAGAGFYVWRFGLPGEGRMETWLGRQVTGIVNTYLIPDLEFEHARYTAPGQLDLRNVQLTHPDGTRVLDVPEFSVRLASVPRIGRPIQIEEVIITGGVVNIVQDPETGEIKGIHPMVKVVPGEEDAEDVPPEFRLSNVLRLRQVRIEDAELRYDTGDGSPMTLGGIRLGLDIEPDDTRDEPGWYKLAMDTGRPPGLQIDLAGAVNLDSIIAELERCELNIEVTEDTVAELPPQIQSLLRQFDARGELAASVTGRVLAQEPLASKIDMALELTDFNVGIDELRIPIDSLTTTIWADRGQAAVESLNISMINGTITGSAMATLDDEVPDAAASWSASGLDLYQLLRAREGEDVAESRLAGILTSSGSANVKLLSVPDSMAGGGTLQVRDGRLVMLPILTQLADVMNLAGQFGQRAGNNHTADATFEFTPEGIRVSQAELVTNTIAARARGLIKYDGELDMTVNAGPMERLQGLLGGVGDVLGGLTDRLMAYTVRGSVAEPRIGVRALPSGE